MFCVYRIDCVSGNEKEENQKKYFCHFDSIDFVFV